MEINKNIRHPIITPSKNINFGVSMGHVQQLPWTGLIQWGNDATYVLRDILQFFAIFREALGFSYYYLVKRRLANS